MYTQIVIANFISRRNFHISAHLALIFRSAHIYVHKQFSCYFNAVLTHQLQCKHTGYVVSEVLLNQ